MIFPTIWVDVQSPGGTDLHGQPILGPITCEKVAGVKLNFTSQHSTVRTDSGATHGHAHELSSDVVLLAVHTSKIQIDDILTLLAHQVKVVRRQPRYQATGIFDHVELGCIAWK
jgi:hypothetical protein